MANINIMDFDKKKYETNVDVNDVEFIVVKVLSGDEVLTVYRRAGKVSQFDAADFSGNDRLMGFYDGQYVLKDKSKILEWLNRGDTYEWFWEEGE